MYFGITNITSHGSFSLLCHFKILMRDARYPGAGLLCAAAAHRVPAADGQDLSPLEPAHLPLHEHLSKYKRSKSSTS